MMRTWKMLGLHTLLAAALSAPHALASAQNGEPTGPKPPTDSQKLDRIQKQLETIGEKLPNIDTIKKELQDLRQDLKTQGELRAARDKGVQDQLEGLTQRLTELEGTVRSLRGQLDSQTRTAAYPPAGGPGLTTGRIRLVNNFPGQVSVVVNGRNQRLEPGETRDVEPQPAGAFSYEVIGIQLPKTLNLAPGEALTIRVNQVN